MLEMLHSPDQIGAYKLSVKPENVHIVKVDDVFAK